MGNNNSFFRRKRKSSKKSNPHRLEPTNSCVENKQKYYLTNNHEDIDLQHMYHFFKRHLFENNFSSPVEDKLINRGCKVLDIGCGPGTWLLDLANEYEKSHFYGLDINPVFPNEIKPRNLKFIEADIFNRLPFRDNEFDFVHQESMSLILAADHWNHVISEMIRITKPGGYIELLETYSTFKGIGPILEKLHDAHITCCLQRGVDMNLIPNLDAIIKSNQNISKVDRDEKTYILGPNGGKMGMMNQGIVLSFHNNEVAMENLCPILGISKEEYKNMVTKDLIEELKHTKPEYMLIRYWAQKDP